MRHLLVTSLVVWLLCGCADPRSTFSVGSSEGLSAADAESLQVENTNALRITYAGARLDQPLRLLKAPQPPMPRQAISQNIEGEVKVAIRFNELGGVEGVKVLSSSHEILAAAVVSTVSAWQIAPVTAGGRPAKATVQQSFKFLIK